MRFSFSAKLLSSSWLKYAFHEYWLFFISWILLLKCHKLLLIQLVQGECINACLWRQQNCHDSFSMSQNVLVSLTTEAFSNHFLFFYCFVLQTLLFCFSSLKKKSKTTILRLQRYAFIFFSKLSNSWSFTIQNCERQKANYMKLIL